METLPWQVAFGNWIGWTAGAALVVTGCALFWLWLRWLALRRAHQLLSKFGPATTAIELGPVVLRGRIVVPGAPVPALDGSGAAAACTVEASSETFRFAPHKSGARRTFRAPVLRIETTDGTASIAGAVLVTVGSRETFPASLTSLDAEDQERLRSAPDNASSFGTKDWPNGLRVAGTIKTLRHGDDVIVRGVVRRHISDGGPGASYRPTAAAFEVTAPNGVASVEVAAQRLGALSFGKTAFFARGLTVGFLLSLAVGVIFGGSARRVGDYPTASIFLLHRAWAIDELSKEAVEGTPSEERLAQILAYEAIDPDCQRTGEALMDHQRWKQAGDLLVGCEQPRLQRRAATAYLMAGALTQACEALRKQTDPTGEQSAHEALIFAMGGCLHDSAQALRRFAKRSKDEEPRETVECVADALDAHEDEAARARLAARGPEACQLAYASLMSGKQRLRALSFLAQAPASERARHRHNLLLAVLRASEGDDPAMVRLPALPTLARLLDDPDAIWSGRAHGIEADVLQRLAANKSPTDAQRSLRRILAIRAAAFETLAGDIEGAGLFLDVANRDNEALRSSAALSEELWLDGLRVSAQVASLRVLGHVLQGQPDKAEAVLAPWHDVSPSSFLKDQRVSDSLPAAIETIRLDVVRSILNARAVIGAAQGKVLPDTAAFLLGARLAPPQKVEGEARLAQLVRTHPSTGGLALLATTAHRLKAQAGDLTPWLRYHARQPSDGPMTLLLHASLAARSARALGAPEVAQNHESAAAGYRSGLLRRETALVFALVNPQ